MTYRAPVKDMAFVLEHVAGMDRIRELPPFGHAEADLVEGLLSEAGRFCAEVIAPTNEDGDVQHTVLSCATAGS
jgi:3-(methylthio)propanoyl-CoA dehydrogenase